MENRIVIVTDNGYASGKKQALKRCREPWQKFLFQPDYIGTLSLSQPPKAAPVISSDLRETDAL
ncbi:hypothetical protein GCM10019059_40230 [Camelimonas fluminis]|nr:hypothetical protein GCM10019059_40230 [Camelimonas fluminis]